MLGMGNDFRWKKALWVAEELGEDVEDVYDVILGNITEPQDFVANVEQLAQAYDNKKSGQFFSVRVYP
jgi:hypothetical protein